MTQRPYDAPPHNLLLDCRNWLANRDYPDGGIYPNVLGEVFDARAEAVWVAGTYVELWQTTEPHDRPDEKHARIKHEIFRRIEKIAGRAMPAPTPSPPMTGDATPRPLVGPLRIVHKLFADDTGYRRVDFDSSFNLLRVLREDPARFYRRVEATVRARRQGTRVMLSVGGWAGFWSGYGVHPIAFREWIFDRQAGHLRPAEGLDGPMYGARVDAWPDFDNLFRTLLRAYRSRGLRLHIAFGDAQIITPDPAVEIALHERLARIAAEEGGAQVIALWEVTNEYPMNRHGGGSDASITQMGRVIAAVKSYLPDVLCGQGAALSEEPDDLARSVRVGDVCISHPPRSPIDVCFKRTMNLVYWENNPYRGFPVPFVQAEPKGPNVGPMDGIGDDMYLPTNDPGEITALYALHHLTGQWSTFFDGAAVRSIGESDEAWGFDELPAIFDRHLPEDVATWDRSTAGRGAILYWSRGDQCATAYHSSWDPTPPRPIAEWTHYGTGVTTGTGPPPRETGFLVGRF